jgi:hypothetical protein
MSSPSRVQSKRFWELVIWLAMAHVKRFDMPRRTFTSGLLFPIGMAGGLLDLWVVAGAQTFSLLVWARIALLIRSQMLELPQILAIGLPSKV